jgi:hypothetical protein
MNIPNIPQINKNDSSSRTGGGSTHNSIVVMPAVPERWAGSPRYLFLISVLFSILLPVF